MLLSNERNFFHLLNAIRGVAAIMVVGRHVPLFWLSKLPISYMAVDIFFLLSGVVIEANYHDKFVNGMTPWRFMQIRIARIYPLYILGTCITFTTLLFIGPLIGPHPGIGLINNPAPHIFFALLILPYQSGDGSIFVFNHPAWSLFFELLVNAVYAFTAIRLDHRRLTIIVILLGVAFLGTLAYFLPKHMIELGFQGPQTYFGGFVRAAFSFFLGAGLYRINSIFNIELIRRHSAAATCTVLLAVVLSLAATPAPPYQFYFYIFCVFLFFPTIVFIALSVKSGSLTEQVWNFLGNISYAIYALHVPIFVFISSVIVVSPENDNLIHKLLTHHPLSTYVLSLLTCAYVMDKTFDRISRNFLRELHFPWRRVTAATAKDKDDQTFS